MTELTLEMLREVLREELTPIRDELKTMRALRAAEVPDDKARAAAVEVASFENRLAKVEADLLLIKWMLGFNIAVTVAVMLRVFLH